MEITRETYEDLAAVCQSFAKGDLGLVIIVGDAGLGKSRAIKAAVDDRVRIIEGQLSAFQLYIELWRHRNQPVVIDDVDKLYVDKDSVRLLKLVCQTENVKTIQWNTASPKLHAENIPNQFDTCSSVCIIANEFRTLNPNTIAIADRGVTVHFEPSALEVHRQVGTWFNDPEVYEFIEENLDQIRRPSQRTYWNARNLKNANLDWKSALQQTWKPDARVAALQTVFEDVALKTQGARQKRWSELTGRDRATFYRLANAYPDIATLRHYGSN